MRRALLRPVHQSDWIAKWLPRIRLAALIFLAWTVVGLFEALPETLVNSPPWAVFIGKILDAWAWAMLTPAIMWIDRKLAARQTSVARIVLLFLVLSVPFSLVHTYLAGALLYPVAEVSWSPLRNRDFVIYYYLGGWATYCGIIGVLQAFRFYHRDLTGRLQLERVERSLLQSRLLALRLQLEPHFLFNALNTISSELTASPELAREMIGDLGTLLRQSLDCKEEHEISLAQELALLDHYVSIQKVRFGDRIQIGIDVEPEILMARVPSMLLQPLVENAVRHGIEGRISGGSVEVSASKCADQLRIEVVDDGVGLPRDWRMERSSGHGLRVTRERLSALYPEISEQRLAMHRRKDGGTAVTILVPLDGAGMERHGIVA